MGCLLDSALPPVLQVSPQTAPCPPVPIYFSEKGRSYSESLTDKKDQRSPDGSPRRFPQVLPCPQQIRPEASADRHHGSSGQILSVKTKNIQQIPDAILPQQVLPQRSRHVPLRSPHQKSGPDSICEMLPGRYRLPLPP